ncbi:MAG TPA: hypothetical protein VGE07_09125, partial [Herpetosiphonaceae bacterium]
MPPRDQLPRLVREQLEQDIPATIDLWPRIAAQLPAPRRPGAALRGRRWGWRLRAVAGAAVLLAVVTLPPLRALATDLLYQLGVIQITNAPTHAELIAAGQTPTPLAPDVPVVSFSFDGEQIPELTAMQAQVGYPVYQAAVLPEGARLFDRDSQHVMHDDYATATAYMLRDQRTLLTLFQAREGKLRTQVNVGTATTEAVTINGHAGVWIEGVGTGVTGTTVQRSNQLVWNAHGFTFELWSGTLS